MDEEGSPTEGSHTSYWLRDGFCMEAVWDGWLGVGVGFIGKDMGGCVGARMGGIFPGFDVGWKGA